MPVPDFQTIMLPLLQIAGDGQEHNTADTITKLASYFNLTPEERGEILPSGTQFRFDNRIGWSRTHLTKAGLLDTTGRGTFRISSRGVAVLKSNPKRIDMKFLRQFPQYAEFQYASRKTEPGQISEPSIEEEKQAQTPDDMMASGYQILNRTLAQDLLDKVKKVHPAFFERLVVDLLVAMGYGGSAEEARAQVTGQAGDDGIDGIIKEDKLGLDAIYIQAKRWAGSVGRPVVQAFAGSLEGQRARKGVMITTSSFTPDARDYVRRIEKKIVLIDGDLLADLMIEYGIGVAKETTYVIKKIDIDYFEQA